MGLQSILSPADFSPHWFDLALLRLSTRLGRLKRWLGRARPLSIDSLLMVVHADAPARITGASIAQKSSDDRLAPFQRLILPELDAAYNFARFLSRDADAAHDICQNAFLRAYRGFEAYRGGDPRAWLLTIVRNCYHDWLSERRRKARVEVDTLRTSAAGDDVDEQDIEGVASQEDTPEDALLRKTESETVRLVLVSLPKTLREVLVLREIEGFSYRQIAEISAVPIGTVMSRLARARKEFGEAWLRNGDALRATP